MREGLGQGEGPSLHSERCETRRRRSRTIRKLRGNALPASKYPGKSVKALLAEADIDFFRVGQTSKNASSFHDQMLEYVALSVGSFPARCACMSP